MKKRLPHQMLNRPERAAIVRYLDQQGGEAPFLEVQAAVGLTASRLGTESYALEDRGLISMRKEIAARRVRTWLALTALGRQILAEHQPVSVRPRRRRILEEAAS